MTTAFFEKTVKFLAKTENPSANDLLRVLLDDSDWQIRSLAFDALYLKQDPAIHIELLIRFLAQPEAWIKTKAVHADRLAKLFDAAVRSNNFKLLQAAVPAFLKYRVYDAMKSLLPFLESPKEELSKLAGESVLAFAERFYEEMAACNSAVDLRNLDRRREWFSAELENPVRRYSVHQKMEPLKAFLLVTKKDYPSFLNVVRDHHSQASQLLFELLEKGEHGGYLRLLLGFLDDVSTPPHIDIIITKRQDERFVRNLLDVIGPAPKPQEKQAYKRFQGFDWIKSDNPNLPGLIEGLEPNFVQLLTSISLPRQDLIEMLRFVFSKCVPKGRRAAAEALRSLSGEDYNLFLLEVAEDPDPITCSILLKLIKSRHLKEADAVIMRCIERTEPEVLETIYELMPDFHIESYLQKIEQLPEKVSRTFGRIVRKIDPNTSRILLEELNSMLPIRRVAAINAIKDTELGPEFQEALCHLIQEDREANVRLAACNALAEVLTVESLQALKAATEDRAFALRAAATEAVQKWSELYARAKPQ